MANLDKLCDNGSCKSIYKCKSKTCKLKSNFILRDNVVITSSKRIFDCEVPNETRYIDYNSPNVIYLSLEIDVLCIMLENLFRNWRKYLTGIEMGLKASVAF